MQRRLLQISLDRSRRQPSSRPAALLDEGRQRVKCILGGKLYLLRYYTRSTPLDCTALCDVGVTAAERPAAANACH